MTLTIITHCYSLVDKFQRNKLTRLVVIRFLKNDLMNSSVDVVKPRLTRDTYERG
jgi:hypothetical protein